MAFFFDSFDNWKKYATEQNISLVQVVLEYEQTQKNRTDKEIWSGLSTAWQVMKEAVVTGLTEDMTSRSGMVNNGAKKVYNYPTAVLSKEFQNLVSRALAAKEVNSCMGRVVAAPTAGSCGALPGALFGVAHSLDLPEDVLVKAMLSAGLIGVFIAAHATFAAEVGGCMAETGSGGGMASAAIVEMMGGTLQQSIAAASLALQNSLGIICDPIGNRVEAPCLGRNVMAATNAVSCANMALSDYEHLVPLDEVIDTMKAVGDQIHHTLRCTNLGGLSVTPAAKKIEAMLEEQPKKLFKSC